jgi:hypothetical protein
MFDECNPSQRLTLPTQIRPTLVDAFLCCNCSFSAHGSHLSPFSSEEVSSLSIVNFSIDKTHGKIILRTLPREFL